jgi:D-serine deaminase-like pyridoxal phosphate-dependent protein
VDLLAADVPTPALLVDRAAAERNIARAVAALPRGVALRPHFKAHKCTRLLELQLAAGGCVGVTCATAYEAEVVATRFPGLDVLVANETVDPHALAALARASGRARVTACVDDPRHVELLADPRARLEVLVEVDVGQRRCGVEPGGAVALAELVDATPGLTLRGLQGYEGHAVLLADRAERAKAVDHAAHLLAAERDALRDRGLRCDVVSGGGTGTLDLAAAAGVLTEIQAGSYVLMDASYGGLGLPFERALVCRSTVISRSRERVVLDAGLKALSAEYGLPRPAEPGALEVLSLADEHATARVPADSTLAVGDPVLLVPAHVDPTVNLHPALFAVGEDAVERWPVDARRQ